MARILHRYQQQQAFKAASVMNPKTVVGLDTVANQVVPLTNATQRPHGIIQASAAQGAAVTVYEDTNVVKAIAAASLGFGAEVGIASLGVSSQAQGGSVIATVALLGPVTGASGVVSWAVGRSEEPASAGEVFAVLLRPRQIAGTP